MYLSVIIVLFIIALILLSWPHFFEFEHNVRIFAIVIALINLLTFIGVCVKTKPKE
ncbi:hypothetical protein [Staphylococcus felis]|uniref:hypothetical protein n=1 Tax=Staphylococcus felis TaxID=46127 RepID=UPI0019D4201B|nr:hypothetical protein [Staphylococcus felis]